jgi:hypothetical protein
LSLNLVFPFLFFKKQVLICWSGGWRHFPNSNSSTRKTQNSVPNPNIQTRRTFPFFLQYLQSEFVSHLYKRKKIQFFSSQEGGIRAYFRGNTANILKVAPESAVKFYAYETVKKMFNQNEAEITPYQRMIAGASAGVIAHTTCFPLEGSFTRKQKRREKKNFLFIQKK